MASSAAALGAFGTPAIGWTVEQVASGDSLDRLLDGPLSTLADEVRAKRLSAVDIAHRVANRIEARRDLNAFVAFDRTRFLETARALEGRDFANSSLLGVPIGLKDNIDAPPFATTAGTPALKQHFPRREAELVTRLRAAGALIAGKTNMDELAAWGTTNNGVFGRTRNPHAAERHTGGSSGGSAAAVAARLVPAAIGTDTAGSIRNPASFCGCVGFRPTHDRVPSVGVVPLARARDSIGPFARSVRDVTVLDAVLTGDTAPVRTRELRGLRIGVPKLPFQRDLSTSVRNAFDATLGRMQAAGVELIEGEIDALESLVDSASVISIGGAFRADLAAYLRESGAPVDVEEVFRGIWNPSVRQWLSEYFVVTPEIQTAFRTAESVTIPRLRANVERYFQTHRLDAIAFPCTPIVAGIEVPGTPDLVIEGRRVPMGVWRNIQNNAPASVWDGPGLSLPIGLSGDGLPIGLELDGPLRSDRKFLGVALAIESLI